eukprot:CAMPEP_0117870452 /NCGR_PEP_ID=MMETSP0950-20121206/9848_1 /TAXON_ID=44440 /ORGANISM="Chattonella subsalsa, Strain CCMP2191" /LENGTH=86 /DNA_ID=CAMNT_0005722741 /DNA_START=64 /DNA_END=325 /DNA_ORIENTATION=-
MELMPTVLDFEIIAMAVTDKHKDPRVWKLVDESSTSGILFPLKIMSEKAFISRAGGLISDSSLKLEVLRTDWSIMKPETSSPVGNM